MAENPTLPPENPANPNLRVFLLDVDYLGDNIGNDWTFTLSFERQPGITLPLAIRRGQRQRVNREVFNVGRPPSVDGSTTQLTVLIQATEADPRFDDRGFAANVISTRRFVRQRIGVSVTAAGGDKPRTARLVFTFIVVASPNLDDAIDTNGNVLIIDPSRPRTQTQERFQCARQVIERTTRIVPHVRFRPTEARLVSTAQITGEAELTAELSVALSGKISATFGAAIGAAGLAAESTLEGRAQAAARFLLRLNFVLIRYVFLLRGTLERFKVAEIRQLTDWVGADCEALGIPPNPQVEVSRVEGERVSQTIEETFVVYEVAAPGKEQGEEAVRQTELLDAVRTFLESQDFSAVPDPAGLPMPLNLGG
ncbi:MAG: hypothetical protein M3Z21_09190 [Pseudomonadota bacterium]|nr:hypothetical protein [Pseudomonadota bacterium]